MRSVIFDETRPTPGRKPFVRKVGTYAFVRQMGEYEITMYEPVDAKGQRHNYRLSVFEMERILTTVVGMTDEEARTTLDRTWNFFATTFDTGTRLVVPIQRKDARALVEELTIAPPPDSVARMDRVLAETVGFLRERFGADQDAG